MRKSKILVCPKSEMPSTTSKSWYNQQKIIKLTPSPAVKEKSHDMSATGTTGQE